MSSARSSPASISAYESVELEEGGHRSANSPMLGPRRRISPSLGPPGRRDYTGWIKAAIVFILGALVGMA